MTPSSEPLQTPAGKTLTDRDRLNWLIARHAYVMEHKTVPRWGVYTSQACLEEIGHGSTPRSAIDNAIHLEQQPAGVSP